MKAKVFALMSILLMVGAAFLCCSFIDEDSDAASGPGSVDLYLSDQSLVNWCWHGGSLSWGHENANSTSVYEVLYYQSHYPGWCRVVHYSEWCWVCNTDEELEINGYARMWDVNHNLINNTITNLVVYNDHIHIDFTFPDISRTYYVGIYECMYDPSGGYLGDITTAKAVTYVPPTRTVSFNANGGTASAASSTVNVGSSITLPSASKPYCTFSGWFTAASGGTRVGGAGDSYTVNNNVTLYAQYNVIPVSITTAHGTEYMVQGSSFAYTVGTNPADATVSVSGANWLTVSGKTVTGVPTASAAPAGTYHITVTASYGTQSSVQTFDIVVAEKLIFESVPTGGIIATPV